MNSRLSLTVAAAVLMSMTAGCAAEMAADGSEDIATQQQGLSASFGSFVAVDAGWNVSPAPGGVARLAWLGIDCDRSSCVVEAKVNGGGWFRQNVGVDYYYVNPQILELPNLPPNQSVGFRITKTIPGTRVVNGGVATTSPSYTVVSPEVFLTVADGKYTSRITTQNQGLPGLGAGVPSPFFNSVDPSTNAYRATVSSARSYEYAFLDTTGRNALALTPFLPTFLTINGVDTPTDTLPKSVGPAFPFVFDTNTSQFLPPAFDFRNVHSNLLAKDGSGQANMIVFSDFDTWTTTTRHHFIAAHIAVDRTTGLRPRGVSLVAGDLEPTSGNGPSVILQTSGEPPRIIRWDVTGGDFSPAPRRVGKTPRVSGAIEGEVVFTDPKLGTRYRTTVRFEFTMNITAW